MKDFEFECFANLKMERDLTVLITANIEEKEGEKGIVIEGKVEGRSDLTMRISMLEQLIEMLEMDSNDLNHIAQKIKEANNE